MSDTAMLRRELDADALSDRQRIEADEEGMLRIVATHATKVRYIVGRSTPNATRSAWTANRLCIHCKSLIDAPTDAALVVLPDKSHRVAHRGMCFVFACLATNPALPALRTASDVVSHTTHSRKREDTP